MQHYEPVEDEVPVIINQLIPPNPLHNDPMHHYERAEDEFPVNQLLPPKPLHNDPMHHYEHAEDEVPVNQPKPLHDDATQHYECAEVEILSKPQAKRCPKKGAVTSTANPVYSPTSTSNEAFITFASNKSDHLHQFMKPLD